PGAKSSTSTPQSSPSAGRTSCSLRPSLVQVTVVPGATWMFSGRKKLSRALTVTSSPSSTTTSSGTSASDPSSPPVDRSVSPSSPPQAAPRPAASSRATRRVDAGRKAAGGAVHDPTVGPALPRRATPGERGAAGSGRTAAPRRQPDASGGAGGGVTGRAPSPSASR